MSIGNYLIAMIYQAPTLEVLDEEVLSMIRELWVELNRNLEARPTKWTGWLAKNTRARAIQGSNSIEGYNVSAEAALAAIDGERPEQTDETSWRHVVNYREAMDYVLTLANAPDFQYSSDLIRSLHFLIARAEDGRNPGRWRPGAIYVKNNLSGETVYEGPRASDVAALMSELCESLTAEDAIAPTRMIRAAMAHLNLVMIHPFSDGNGRMARCLQTLVLARGGIMNGTFSSIEEYLGRNTGAYYQVLADVGQGSWKPKNKALPWVRFCLTAHFRQATSVHRRLERVAQVYDAVEKMLHARRLPDRAGAPVVNAALNYVVRNEDYRREADVSMNLASRDLKQLADAGILVAIGEKRGRHYVAGPDLKALAAKHQDPSPVPDPYSLAKHR